MSIPDPHAIPENDADCAEYLTEADQAWEAGNADLAYDLYFALRQAASATGDQKSHASHRLALTAMNRGDVDAAWNFATDSHEPGAADLLHSLDNATPDDPAVDPDVVPQTMEQTEDWWQAGATARGAGDYALSQRIFYSIAISTCNPPITIAKAEYLVAEALHHTGDDTNARSWLEKALPGLEGAEELEPARALFGEIGVVSHPDASSPAAQHVVDGVDNYQYGDLPAARAFFEAALHADGPDEVKGRAHYYLGAMDYQDHHYADARNHIDIAAASAPDQERGWAAQMLTWDWQEAPSP
ncbi:MAG: hypothetical protein ABI345_15900 [Jatrophihabitans sp.]